jgi:hypothetical protein
VLASSVLVASGETSVGVVSPEGPAVWSKVSEAEHDLGHAKTYDCDCGFDGLGYGSYSRASSTGCSSTFTCHRSHRVSVAFASSIRRLARRDIATGGTNRLNGDSHGGCGTIGSSGSRLGIGTGATSRGSNFVGTINIGFCGITVFRSSIDGLQRYQRLVRMLDRANCLRGYLSGSRYAERL